MARVNVYQFDYFDGLLKRVRRSVDFATADAIAAMRATILAESVRAVDEDLLDERGVIKAKDLPPRELEPAREPWAASVAPPSTGRARGGRPRPASG